MSHQRRFRRGDARNGLIRERRFETIMRSRGIALERVRKPFRFRRCIYRPDFYSPTEGVYYEVLGSRQRAHTILPLFELMELVYPDVILRPVRPDGSPVTTQFERRLSALNRLPFGEALVRRMTDEGLGICALSRRIGYADSRLSQAFSVLGSGGEMPSEVARRLREFAETA